MSTNDKLTKSEIERLLQMLKDALIESINFPTKGTSSDFKAIGVDSKESFTIEIYRGKINPKKYNYNARVDRFGVPLLELHVSPGNTHINPDGSKIMGSHWHIYTIEEARRIAYPAEDILSENFVKNTIAFFSKFNIEKKPFVFYQEELL